MTAAHTFPSGVTFEADDFRPRIFYRSAAEIGVLEGPALARRVLRVMTDPGEFICCGPLEYEASTNTLFTKRQTGPGFEILAVDADTGVLRGAIAVDDRPGFQPLVLMANHERGTLRAAVGVSVAVFQTHTQLYRIRRGHVDTRRADRRVSRSTE